MREFWDDASIPARGAALLERDRLLKTGLCAAGLVVGLGVVYRFYKPLLTAAAVVYVSTRPPVKRFLRKAAGLLRREPA